MPNPSWLALDLRALALFRICLGLLALLDLGYSAWNVDAFFSDNGILPGNALQLPLASRWLVAFQCSGETWVQLLWMSLTALCALLVLLGHRSRWALLGLWYLLCSLHVRNSLGADRGIMLLELMCFWGLFLPLEARWSLAARKHPHWAALPDLYRSPATVALLVQFAFIYFFSALLKNGVAWVVDFNAAEIACRSAQVSTAYSEWLGQFSTLLSAATVLTLLGEAAVPLILFSPIGHDRLRVALVLGLECFHLHNQLLFRLGFFPLMNALFCLVLLPTSFFDRLLGVPTRKAEPQEPLPPAYGWNLAQAGWLALCLAYCLYCNLQTYPKPRKAHLVEPMRSFGKFFRLEQYWYLFSPSPPNDLWFRLIAHDAQGHEVSLWRRDGRVTLDREVSPMGSVPTHMWQMVLLNSVYNEKDELSRSIVDYWERRYRGRYQDFRYEVLTRELDSQVPRVRQLWPKGHVRRVVL